MCTAASVHSSLNESDLFNEYNDTEYVRLMRMLLDARARL